MILNAFVYDVCNYICIFVLVEHVIFCQQLFKVMYRYECQFKNVEKLIVYCILCKYVIKIYVWVVLWFF